MDLSNICFSCFTNTGGINPCPHCGFDRMRVQQNPLHLAPGTILNRTYLLGYTIGQGGFGITYKGYDLNMQRVVAIKEYFPMGQVTRHPPLMVLASDENSRTLLKKGVNLFFKEALMLANFNSHPNIVNVIHFFRENNTAYIVMEYLNGQSLKDYLLGRGNSISFNEAQQILCPIMAALSDLHRGGLLHRDVAPDNIFLTSDGQAKLLDFGAARFGVANETMNISSVIKPGYAPLEQYSGRSGQGTWTDVYAMGATFYRALTGALPIPASDRAMGVQMLSPREIGVVLPDAANTAIMKAMSIKPEQRYTSMVEFEKDILASVESLPESNKTRTLQQPGVVLPWNPQAAPHQSFSASIPQSVHSQASSKARIPAAATAKIEKPGSFFSSISLNKLVIPLIILVVLLLTILGSVLKSGFDRSNERPLSNEEIVQTVVASQNSENDNE